MNAEQGTKSNQPPTPNPQPPPLAIILFGSPGSGKGTQAKLLMGCLKVPQISTGDILRDRLQSDGSMPPEVRTNMRAGSLVSDEVVNWIVEHRLLQPDCQNGFILDGYPRTQPQAEFLCRWLEARDIDQVVIHFRVDYNMIIARLSGRRQCPRCGALYNVISNPPRAAGFCDVEGTALIIREDDQPSVIRERLDAYEKQTRPLLEYFRQRGHRLLEIDASQDTPEALFRKICRSIREPDIG
jgi:adenylate kinase